MKHSTIFKSRWFALLWAAGIIWFAYDFAQPSDDATNGANAEQATDVTGAPVTADEQKKAADAIANL